MSEQALCLIAISAINAAFFLGLAYRGYVDAKTRRMEAGLMWQRYAINQHLAKHGIAHHQVLPALLRLAEFSFERDGEIWTCSRSEDGSLEFAKKEMDAQASAPEEHRNAEAMTTASKGKD